ncbi:hypothetical protein J2T17_007821 [Paenibacillus mucilaginosus]|uniref:hypothetical protein n=1 Tax=Paenibacillus mucilaginosus TaxID=61624 RepID=UPI003D193708
MKKAIRIGFTVYMILLVLFIVFRIPLSKYIVEKEITTFLNRVIAKDSNVASDFYTRHIEQDTIQKNLEQGGFHLLSFSDVEGDYDDGCVCTGHVNLTFDNDGEPLTVRAIFTDSKQICAISPANERFSVTTKWNKYACGGDF